MGRWEQRIGRTEAGLHVADEQDRAAWDQSYDRSHVRRLRRLCGGGRIAVLDPSSGQRASRQRRRAELVSTAIIRLVARGSHSSVRRDVRIEDYLLK